MSTHLEEELTAALRARAAEVVMPDDLVDRAARRNRRRRASLSWGGGIGAAAVAALTAVAVGGGPSGVGAAGGGPSTAGAASTPAAAPSMMTVAQITARAAAALDGSDNVEHLTMTNRENGALTRSVERWHDPATDSVWTRVEDSSGQVLKEWWEVFEGSTDVLTTTTVDWPARTWSERTRRVPNRALDRGLLGGGGDQLREVLTKNAFELVGTEQVDGHQTHHLRRIYPDGSDDLWVDAETYWIVRRTIKSGPSGLDNSETEWQGSWLARSPESLAPFDIDVPPDFKKVEADVPR